MKQQPLNPYQIMWIFVLFDLPVAEPIQRHRAATFRADLIREGYRMTQFSVYTRWCPSRENRNVHIQRLRALVPPEGFAMAVTITDKQYSDIVNICRPPHKRKLDPNRQNLASGPIQLELF